MCQELSHERPGFSIYSKWPIRSQACSQFYPALTVSSVMRAGDSLAGARLAYKRQSAARHDVDVEFVKDGHQRARWVAEGHVAQLYVTQQEAQLLA